MEKTDEITYTPGRLAKKLGISKGTLMNHLRATGLIDQCYVTRHGHWRIPYSVAVRISSAEALSIPTPTPVSRQTIPQFASEASQRNRGKVSPSFVNEPKPVSVPDYAQIGRSLRRAGITMKDLIKYFEKQRGVTHEQTPNNSAKREENQTDESKATSGGASSDISNSSEK